MQYFLSKWIPPRADFLATLTANESQFMKQHGEFLDAMLKAGLIVAHGPVIDKAGAYGLSLYTIADDQDISAITSRDPIVRQGIDHYEHASMLHIQLRE
jgi:uncharacterized protein YciI